MDLPGTKAVTPADGRRGAGLGCDPGVVRDAGRAGRDRAPLAGLVVAVLGAVAVVLLAADAGPGPVDRTGQDALVAGPTQPSGTARPEGEGGTAAGDGGPGTSTRKQAPRGPALPRVVPEGDGELVVVAGGSEPAGDGPLLRYVVEVEGGLGVQPVLFAEVVERTLADPRSWVAEGRSVQRVDDPAEADVRVALASPTTTDRLCAPLRTNGIFSCEVGLRAVINQMRWLEGADSYVGDLTSYRQYVLNHEVGHALGHGHVQACDAQGRSPVMAQQTKSLFGCGRNPWPYPDAGPAAGTPAGGDALDGP